MALTPASPLLLGALGVALVVCSCLAPAAHGFIGIIGGKSRVACETDGGICFTEDACCQDYSCEKASQATSGRCTPTKAAILQQQQQLLLEEDPRQCDTDADCPSDQCCATESYGPRGLTHRRVCRPGAPSDCATGQSAENLFSQYYSGLFR